MNVFFFFSIKKIWLLNYVHSLSVFFKGIVMLQHVLVFYIDRFKLRSLSSQFKYKDIKQYSTCRDYKRNKIEKNRVLAVTIQLKDFNNQSIYYTIYVIRK